MNTQPDPKNLFLIIGPFKKRTHLGYVITHKSGVSKRRALCCAKLCPDESRLVYQTNGKATCPLCIKRYNLIQKKIKALGVEWVCYGHYLPMNKRQFRAKLPGTLRIQRNKQIDVGYHNWK